jgi:protein gp37
MATNSKIEWTEQTWNPVTGCIKVSPGCKHCYAETLAKRLQAMGAPGYANGFSTITLIPERLKQPLSRKKPTLYFVNSMSDLFQEAVPFGFIDQVMDVIEATPRHAYQILTKRAERMKEYFSTRTPPKNAWLGVSVEDKKYGVPRMAILRRIKAKTRFLSVEPLLEDLGVLNLSGIHWVIVGGESGPKARPMQETWAVNIKDQCLDNEIDFFFKQWGSYGKDGVRRSKKENGRALQGKTWNVIPTVLMA